MRSLVACCAGLALACASSTGPTVPELDDPWYRSGAEAIARADHPAPPSRRARNVILFVGDGMGISTVTAARILAGQLEGRPGEEGLLAFESLPFVALAKTYNTNQQVPDSAGTMTAMMSGVKTKAGVVGLDDRAMRGDANAAASASVPTLLEQAEARGLATGVVTTARLTHATPAACYAHIADRNWESDDALPDGAQEAGLADIAAQLVGFEPGDGIEVALGGGRSRFLPREMTDPEDPDARGARTDGRDLTAEWLAKRPGSAYVWNAAQLDALDPAEASHVLGLFERSHMEWEADRERDAAGEPSLAEMTTFAINVLARDPDGFFLMVEAGRIDHGHHLGNARRALIDTIALSDAVAVALEKTNASETLIVVTADHSHTLTIGGYVTRGNPILGLVRENGPDGRPRDEVALDTTGHPYTTLGYANGPGYPGASEQQPEGSKHFPHMPRKSSGTSAGRPDLREVDTEALSYLQESAVPTSMETHAGEDVAIYAGGPGAHRIHGVLEQHVIYHAMRAALGW